MTPGDAVAACVVVGLVAAFIAFFIGYHVSNSVIRAEEAKGLKCPHEFCTYRLPLTGLTEDGYRYIPEDCGGCGRKVLFKPPPSHRSHTGSYERIAE